MLSRSTQSQNQLYLTNKFGNERSVYLLTGRSIGQRFVPMGPDLSFLLKETLQEVLDENKQKVRDAVRHTRIGWAKSKRLRMRVFSCAKDVRPTNERPGAIGRLGYGWHQGLCGIVV